MGRLTGIHLGDQVNLTLDAYLDGTLFNSISKDSYQLLAHGREADMVKSIWSLFSMHSLMYASNRCLEWVEWFDLSQGMR